MLKRLWKLIDGKKSLSGILIAGAGVVMLQIPFTAPAAPYFIYTGLGTLTGGTVHKVHKLKRTKKE